MAELVGVELDVDHNTDGLSKCDHLHASATLIGQEDVLDPGVAVAMPEQLELWNVQVGFAPAGSRPLGGGYSSRLDREPGAAAASRSARWASDSCICLSRSRSKSKVDSARYQLAMLGGSPWLTTSPS